MIEPHLQHLIIERLAADDEVEQPVADLVLAGCEGPDAVAASLAGTAAAPAVMTTQPRLPSDPPGAYLASIGVQGFRGIGSPATLKLTPGPGLTLVVGRNGSGKSSFAEGLELLMTGANLRWEERTRVWREGWQNLHAEGGTRLSAELHVDGRPGVMTLRRGWSSGAELDDGRATEVDDGGEPMSLAELGWDEALSRYRPFLSYNELGTMFDRLATMYDAMASMLGLEDVDALATTLRDARLEREAAARGALAERDRLLGRLVASADERAAAAAGAIRTDAPDLDALERVLDDAGGGTDPTGELGLLRTLAALHGTPEERASAAFEQFEAARSRLAGMRDTDAARDAGVADLLHAALEHHAHHPGADCPVCGTADVLDDGWREGAAKQVAALRERAASFEAARQAVQAARRSIGELVSPLRTDVLEPAASAVGLDAKPLIEAWGAWRAEQEALDGAGVDDARRALARLTTATETLAGAARDELARRDDVWRPLAGELRAWLPSARATLDGAGQVERLRAAERWVRAAATDLQAERLAPIAEAAASNWERLRHESNVTLDGFYLRKSGNVRAAEVDVRVDGSEASAFGVMSQGELHALAVSVFLPRAGFRESPFRFMVIDDPLQSMDPAKVDGLARVLSDAAAERQVIVFTHDARLPEAVRRLNLAVTILEVTRRPGSVVEIRAALRPVERYLEDARALVLSEDVPAAVAQAVVPGFCRHAIEAACVEVVRRRRLLRGDAHAEVEAAIGRATTMYTYLALALFDDERRARQVLGDVYERFGRKAGDAAKAANAGVHGEEAGDLRELVRATGKLARKLVDLA